MQSKNVLRGIVLIAGGMALYAVLKGLAPVAQTPPAPHLVTAEIQAGIEKYIEDQAARNGGYFKFSSGGKEFSFKLVRVHTEYLARLGPKRHFACVDMVDLSGDVYDIDFFLAGTAGNMTVTETSLHKLNGIPFYTWEQEKGKWKRVPTQDASPRLLGVVRETDEFEFRYLANIPDIKTSARLWIPYALSDSYQDVKVLQIDAPRDYRIVKDKQYQNHALFFNLLPEDSGKTVDILYRVKRREKAAYDAAEKNLTLFLRPERLVPLDSNFKKIAEKTVKNKTGDLVRARALYDHVIERMRYMKYGTGWGKGDAVYACNLKTGNCTDFHAYFIALARSVGIPARFAVGAAIPSERNEGGIDGYHCWVEFHAEGKWWPVDISEADKYSSLSTYYFGHHPANRVEMSRGRDLVFEPGPKFGPINFLAHPVFETEGKLIKVTGQFSFKRVFVHR